MLESVCIVLNEREASKAKTAEALQAKLTEENITVSRTPVDSKIEKIVVEKCPPVLVLDYLLGDYSTGLDILQKLQSIDEGKRPSTIFLTDEPSVSVAVEAMRLGALHYFEIDNPQSVNNVVKEIKDILKKNTYADGLSSEQPVILDDLIARSKPSRELIKRAHTLATSNYPCLVIYGGKGSGKNTLAEAIHVKRESTTHLIRLDLRSFDNDIQQYLPGTKCLNLQLGKDLSLIVQNAEEDDGSIIDAIGKRKKKIWPDTVNNPNQSFLSICTSCLDTAQAWQEILQADLIKIPPLDKQRKQDFAPLIQHFITEASLICKKKLKPIDGEIIKWLSSLEWKNNIKQLKAVVVDAAISSSFSKQDIQTILEERLALWEEDYQAASEILISPLTAATTLEISNFNYRIAAARLGCSIKTLREIISGEAALDSEDDEQ